jgi:hypothetical protein
MERNPPSNKFGHFFSSPSGDGTRPTLGNVALAFTHVYIDTLDSYLLRYPYTPAVLRSLHVLNES